MKKKSLFSKPFLSDILIKLSTKVLSMVEGMGPFDNNFLTPSVFLIFDHL